MARYRTRLMFNINDPEGKWDNVGANTIEWQVSTDNNFNTVLTSGTVDWADKDVPVVVDLDTVGPVYARYRIITALGTSQWSNVVSCDLDSAP